MNGLLCPTCDRVHFTQDHLCWNGRAWTVVALFPENPKPDPQNAAQVARHAEVEAARARLRSKGGS